jgi:signal transduction histidine kinase/ligand-binding sensor domain-containing protein
LSLIEDDQGKLWVATDGAGLIRWEHGAARVFGSTDGLPGLRVEQLTLAADNRIYFFCNNQVCDLESGGCQRIAKPAWVPTNLTAIANSPGRGLWVAASAGTYTGTRLFRFCAGHWSEPVTNYPWPQNSNRSRTYTILEDHSGRLWCGTTGRGVFFCSPTGNWRALEPHFPWSYADGLCLAESEDGVVWLGTRTYGLKMIRPGPPVTALHLPPEFEQSIITCVCQRHDGSIWAGTDSAGLFCWREGETYHYGTEKGVPSLIFALLEDRDDQLLVGTGEGLIRYRGDRFEPAIKALFSRAYVSALYQDKQGRLWTGSSQGLTVWSGETAPLKFYGSSEGLVNGTMRCITQDAEGRILAVISGHGLYRQNGDRFELFMPDDRRDEFLQEAERGIAIHSLLPEADGTVWAASAGDGLAQISGNHFRNWSFELDGLPTSLLLSVLKDNAGNLWCSSENGLFGISRKALLDYRRGSSPRLNAWRLTTMDGLPSKACSSFGQNSAMSSPDGKLWFADGPALAVVDPAKTLRDSKIFPPFVESILADGQPVGLDADGLLQLMSGVRSIEIHYTSPNLLSPDRLRFRYSLGNLDKDWVEAGNRRTAYYNRLPPGHYLFKLMVSGQEENWLPIDQSIGVEIIPRFYERRSVQTAGLLALLFAVGLAVWRTERARQRRRIERLKFQRAMDAERQRIARDIHDDLGAGLTEIIILSDTLSEDIQPQSSAGVTSGKISASARSLTRAMDEVVWAVNPGNDTLESFLNYLNDYAQEYLSRAGITYRWDAPIEIPPLPLSAETRHNLYLACKEAINNATKHAHATEVKIQAELLPHGFRLAILDNGQGFETDAPRSRGSGLRNLKQRLEQLGGRCVIHSTISTGTRVEFTLDHITCPPPATN